jgi:hypothetical protein
MHRNTTAVWAAAALLLLASDAMAQGPIGPEFKVNSAFASNVAQPSLAALAGGELMVAWTQTSGVEPTQARVFDPMGAPVAPQFQLSSANAWRPSVAAAGDSFVVVWAARPGGLYDVMARRFDRSGHPLGAEFLVSAGTPSRDGLPSVAAAADGSFVVAWTNYSAADGSDWGIFARRFGPGAVPLGPPFQVNTLATSRQGRYGPAVAMADDGRFAVVWQSLDSTLHPLSVSGQTYDGAGNRMGAEFQVGGTETNDMSGVAVAPDAAGGFLVAWSRHTDPIIPARIVTRGVTAAGAPAGVEHVVSDAFFADHAWPALAPLAGGRFVVLWRAWLWFPWDFDTDLRARTLDASGVPAGPEFRPVARRLHGGHAVAPTPDGGFVASWIPPQDGPPGEGWPAPHIVYARRFAVLAPAPATLAGAGNGVLEPGESAVLATAWTNSGDAPVSALSAQARAFTGPGDGPYTILDGQASFGAIGPGATVSCSATGDCYGLAVGRPAVRPELHWDAALSEDLSTGQQQRTAVHVGESFADVPPGSLYYRSVETALHRGLTAGCGPSAFCPEAPVTRGQMSFLVLVAREGAGFRPFNCPATGGFEDVPPAHPFCPWIDDLAWREVTSGCGDGKFCPEAKVTRAETAVMVLRTLQPDLQPPGCTTPRFSDVPAASPYCRWVEELARRGVVTGCGGGRYCPDAPVTRAQIAAMLTTAFGLTLYGP